MEGSFAQAANKHHFKRARWRRLWRQQVQDWLIAAVQNIAILCGGVGSAIRARLPRTPRGPRTALGRLRWLHIAAENDELPAPTGFLLAA
jgi:hypothetical protein